MKRLIFALVLACVTGAAAYAVFWKTQAANRQFDCEISWLGHKLSLTPEQLVRVRELNLKYCPMMNGLTESCTSSHDPARAQELARACRESTAKLVEAVSAELTPDQKKGYLQLLATPKCDEPVKPKVTPK